MISAKVVRQICMRKYRVSFSIAWTTRLLISGVFFGRPHLDLSANIFGMISAYRQTNEKIDCEWSPMPAKPE